MSTPISIEKQRFILAANYYLSTGSIPTARALAVAMRDTLPLRHGMPLEERMCRHVVEAMRRNKHLLYEAQYEPSQEAKGYDMWSESVVQANDIISRLHSEREGEGDA